MFLVSFLPMDINFLENVIVLSVKKHRNNLITVLENVPKNKAKEILDNCKAKFGCGGCIVVENGQDVIQLQGDQKFKIEKSKEMIFAGFELRERDKK
jgi:translation initiation factor 1 (eIF-1/SUI1)